MNATSLLVELAASGVRLSRNGDSLHVQAKSGAVTVELRERLSASKPELLALLSESTWQAMREQLLAIAADESLPAELVHCLAIDELTACVGCTDNELRGYLHGMDWSTHIGAGSVPPGYTVVSDCPRCGPVWLPEPIHPLAQTCPWCFRQKAGKPFPRPPFRLILAGEEQP